MTINHTTGPIHVFDLEPGDGVSYRVLFGGLPPVYHPQWACIVFGFAEGRDALITVIFDIDDINNETFGRRWRTATQAQTVSSADYLEEAAYTVFSALLGRAEQQPPEWCCNWCEQLPTATLG